MCVMCSVARPRQERATKPPAVGRGRGRGRWRREGGGEGEGDERARATGGRGRGRREGEGEGEGEGDERLIFSDDEDFLVDVDLESEDERLRSSFPEGVNVWVMRVLDLYGGDISMLISCQV